MGGQEAVSFKNLLLDEQYKQEAKDAWKRHNDETSTMDVLERCRRFNELLSKEFLVAGKTSEVLDALRSAPAKPAAAASPRPAHLGSASHALRTSAAPPARAPSARKQPAGRPQAGAARAGQLTAVAQGKQPQKSAQQSQPQARLTATRSRQATIQASRPDTTLEPAAARGSGGTHNNGGGGGGGDGDDDDDIFGVVNLLNSANDCADNSTSPDYRQQLLQDHAAVLLQKFARRWLARRLVTAMRAEQQATNAAVMLQAFMRGWCARREVARLRLERAAATVQGCWRAVLARRTLQKLALKQQELLTAAVTAQCCWRAVRARRVAAAAKAAQLQQTRAAAIVRDAWRCRQARGVLQELQQSHLLLAAAVTIQVAFRSSRARRSLAAQLQHPHSLQVPALVEQVDQQRPAEQQRAAEVACISSTCSSSSEPGEAAAAPAQRPPSAAPTAPSRDATAYAVVLLAETRPQASPRPRDPDPARPSHTGAAPPAALAAFSSTSLSPLRRVSSATARQQPKEPLPSSISPQWPSREALAASGSVSRQLSREPPHGSSTDAMASGGQTCEMGGSGCRVLAESRQRVQEVGAGERAARGELAKRAIMVRSEHRSTPEAMEVVKRPGGKGPDMPRA